MLRICARFTRKKWRSYYHNEMKAIRLTEYGKVSLNLVTVPKPNKNQLLVKMKSASINHLDLQMSKGYGRKLFETQRPLPITLGRDGSGTVVDVGSDVWNFKVGDEVWFTPNPFEEGTFAEFSVVSEFHASLKPKTLTHHQSASIAYTGVTAWRALHDYGNLQAGQHVLIYGGGGSIGRIAVQLCKNKQCTIVSTCGQDDVETVKKLGADEVFAYSDTSLFEQLSAQPKFDVILDAVGLASFEERSIALLKSGGHYTTVRGNLIISLDNHQGNIINGLFVGYSELIKKKINYFSSQKVHYSWALFWPSDDILSQLAGLVDSGDLEPYFEKAYNLEQFFTAYTELLNPEQKSGKVVLLMNEETVKL
eukprot:TRINITY_DN14780_c0_g1_i1.p1 TRINITY_DN14780_c0_g1~~TRINITY_DN14780_c0_g1_i1.p1  ORF type:complete len:365 (+),score=60.26 TRINITY_DN14780_c0_g1_i1:36-1130(+)